MSEEQKLLSDEEAEAAGTELFRIKPLEWEWYETPFYQCWRSETLNYKAEVSRGRPRGLNSDWTDWDYYTNGVNQGSCASPEEGKQLAEQHWREYLKQALVPMGDKLMEMKMNRDE